MNFSFLKISMSAPIRTEIAHKHVLTQMEVIFVLVGEVTSLILTTAHVLVRGGALS